MKTSFDLSIILWTGYTIQELESNPIYEEISQYLDVAVTGRYVQELHEPLGLKGSSNQQYIFYTSRYTEDDLEKVPVAEVRFNTEGVVITGIDTEVVKGWFSDETG